MSLILREITTNGRLSHQEHKWCRYEEGTRNASTRYARSGQIGFGTIGCRWECDGKESAARRRSGCSIARSRPRSHPARLSASRRFLGPGRTSASGLLLRSAEQRHLEGVQMLSVGVDQSGPICDLVWVAVYSSCWSTSDHRLNVGSSGFRSGGKCWSTAFIMKPTLK